MQTAGGDWAAPVVPKFLGIAVVAPGDTTREMVRSILGDSPSHALTGDVCAVIPEMFSETGT